LFLRHQTMDKVQKHNLFSTSRILVYWPCLIIFPSHLRLYNLCSYRTINKRNDILYNTFSVVSSIKPEFVSSSTVVIWKWNVYRCYIFCILYTLYKISLPAASLITFETAWNYIDGLLQQKICSVAIHCGFGELILYQVFWLKFCYAIFNMLLVIANYRFWDMDDFWWGKVSALCHVMAKYINFLLVILPICWLLLNTCKYSTCKIHASGKNS